MMNPMMGGQAPQGQPQMQGGQGQMDPNQMMEMLMQLLTQSPPAPAGNAPRSLPPSALPADIRNSDPLAAIMPMLQQMLAGSGMMQSGQQMQNGAQGGMGAMFGGQGGRPPQGSVPPSAMR